MPIPSNIEELNRIRQECYSLVTAKAALAGGVAVIPTPGVDIAADIAILLDLIAEINKRFGLSKEDIDGYEPLRRQIIYQVIKQAGMNLIGAQVTKALITQALKKVAGRAVAKQVLKFVPIIGWAANAAIGFSAMKYVGNEHVDNCYYVCIKFLDEVAKAESEKKAKFGEPA